MDKKELDDLKLGPVVSALRVALYADDVLVAETEQVHVWLDVMRLIAKEIEADQGDGDE